MDLLKQINIDADRATMIVAPGNAVTTSISLIRGNEYVICANCYANAYSTNLISNTFSVTDTWELHIGQQYGTNVSPIITITDQSKFNNTSDWSRANVDAGFISARVNVTGSAITADIGNNSSEAYTMEIIATNNVSAKVMVLDATTYIVNSVNI